MTEIVKEVSTECLIASRQCRYHGSRNQPTPVQISRFVSESAGTESESVFRIGTNRNQSESADSILIPADSNTTIVKLQQIQQHLPDSTT